MKNRFAAIVAVLAVAIGFAAAAPPEKGATAPKAAPSAVETELVAYAAKFLPFNPETKVTVEKSSETLAGFQAYKVHRKGRYEKLNLDKVVYLSDDGKWFFAGDTVPNTEPRPVRGGADLSWLDTKFSNMFRSRVRTQLAPDRDAAGLKGVAVILDSGYGPVRMPGYLSVDGRYFLQGTLWDFRMDPRAERRRRIDLSANRATGPESAPVQVVEYADMECSYCKYRGLQMDRLLEANAGIVNVRRHYKFFPLWMGHVWSMKAASAADCIFKFAGPAMFRFKQAVYARQESLSVSGIDELAITTAEAVGVSTADFLSCYLQDDSFSRVKKDIEEGYRLGVLSTPTYYVDGTEIAWVEDKVMEDFLRTFFPKIKTIDYAK
jgi:protein-disulfide isomerase